MDGWESIAARMIDRERGLAVSEDSVLRFPLASKGTSQ